MRWAGIFPRQPLGKGHFLLDKWAGCASTSISGRFSGQSERILRVMELAVKRRRGRSKNGYINTKSKDLEYLGLTISEARNTALIKPVWRNIITAEHRL